jgi:hypothetical protein
MKTTTWPLIAATLLAAAHTAHATPLEPHIDTFLDDERPMLIAETATTRAVTANALEGARATPKAGHRPGDRRASEAAVRGPEPLRRFVTRTDAIYHLRYDAYLRP